MNNLDIKQVFSELAKRNNLRKQAEITLAVCDLYEIVLKRSLVDLIFCKDTVDLLTLPLIYEKYGKNTAHILPCKLEKIKHKLLKNVDPAIKDNIYYPDSQKDQISACNNLIKHLSRSTNNTKEADISLKVCDLIYAMSPFDDCCFIIPK